VYLRSHAYPWWAVDLGAALVVYGVLFTNRADGWGKALGYILASKTKAHRAAGVTGTAPYKGPKRAQS